MEWSVRPTQRTRHRHAFTKAEDKELRQIVNEVGENNWTKVADLMPGRNARQCRDRWRGYLRPTLATSQWTEEEDSTLLQKYEEHGPKWSVIGRSLPTRAETAIKNRWKMLNSMGYTRIVASHHMPYYPVHSYVPVARRHVTLPPVTTLDVRSEDESKKTSESSAETSAEPESLTSAQELEAFFSTLSLSRLRNGAGRF